MSDCILWTGFTNNGYGRVCLRDGMQLYTHRVFYTLYKGAIPPGHDIHHRCRNKLCVNPDHLETLPHGIHARLKNAHKDRCIHGHPFAGENLRMYRGYRSCWTCRRLRNSLRPRAHERAGGHG